MMIINMASSMFYCFVGIFTALKILLIPSYRSTDFEVHRNWLAITHSLPISQWYYESTSEWTLDYPPFFAWFEFCLSQLAQWVDSQMLVVSNLQYASLATIVFQRLSVIGADFIFVYGVKEYCDRRLLLYKPSQGSDLLTNPPHVLAILLLGNIGLLMVDHIHFQYNGFLFGIMLLSVVRISEGRVLEGALWFTTLLNFKHIYLYIAPAYFVYLLKFYCIRKVDPETSFLSQVPQMFARLIRLGLIVISVCLISFGPFIYMNQLTQVVSRLFPFKRGLTHAYWAPNFWALYNAADKVLLFIASRAGLVDKSVKLQGWMTGGLVQEFDHAILPSITPLVTLVLTVISILPALYHLWFYADKGRGFIRCITLCAFGSFMFGWHVHEKAILLVILPLCLLSLEKKMYASTFLILSTTGHLSLFPLIYTPAEMPIKVCLMLSYTVYAFTSLSALFRSPAIGLQLPLLNTTESLYILGLAGVQCYSLFIHRLCGLEDRYPFIPLMFTSVYCALGVTYSWLKFYHQALTSSRIITHCKPESQEGSKGYQPVQEVKRELRQRRKATQ